MSSTMAQNSHFAGQGQSLMRLLASRFMAMMMTAFSDDASFCHSPLCYALQKHTYQQPHCPKGKTRFARYYMDKPCLMIIGINQMVCTGFLSLGDSYNWGTPTSCMVVWIHSSVISLPPSACLARLANSLINEGKSAYFLVISSMSAG